MSKYQRNDSPLESQEGKELVAWLRVTGLKFHHSPNETGHSPADRRRAIRMKQQGTSPGYPDYTILIPGRGVLFIELKRQKGSATSAEQKEWIEAINKIPGAEGHIAKGAAAAIKIVKDVMGVIDDGSSF